MTTSTKFYLCTFGCRCNQADSSEIRARLNGIALTETETPEDASLIVVNSCTVTGRADQQVRQTLRRLHRENPKARIVVTGCYAQRDPETLAGIPGVYAVLGNADRDRLADVWRGEPEAVGRLVRTPPGALPPSLNGGAAHVGGKTRPNLKIQDGCDARCAYCIVPLVRGPGRSAGPDRILEDVRALVLNGFQEIVLAGVHLGAYGRRLPQPMKLTELLRLVLQVPGLGRLRLSSIEPMDFDRGIATLAAAHPVMARHFHIPLQSGSDRILRRMRRPYSAAHYLDLLHFIQAGLPTAGLGSDVLVGFPGESDADFDATCDLVRKSPLTYLHVFPFSARQGTEAWGMEGKVPARIIRQRCRILREISGARNLTFRKSFIGQVLPAVSLAEEELGASVALTDNYIHVRLGRHAVPPNRLIDVRIDEVLPEGTRGALV
jgi:threonylcarbamoyladenosine tRNA methylthiotransferase MtaB